MASFQLRREEDVFILEMQDTENRLDATFLDGFNRALDEIEHSQGSAALVTIAEGKYWSTGIHLDWLAQQSPMDAKRFVRELESLLRRILLLPIPTAAALNGHTFAGGALIALAHDHRVMRSDRGWLCLPEVDINIPFTPGMMALLRARLSPSTLRDAVLSGSRYGGVQAQQLGLVDVATEADQLLPQALACLKPMQGKGREIFGQLKTSMYGATATSLAASTLDAPQIEGESGNV